VGLIEAADEWTFAAVSGGVPITDTPTETGENRDFGDDGPRIVS
jgi:hypothetical protein